MRTMKLVTFSVMALMLSSLLPAAAAADSASAATAKKQSTAKQRAAAKKRAAQRKLAAQCAKSTLTRKQAAKLGCPATAKPKPATPAKPVIKPPAVDPEIPVTTPESPTGGSGPEAPPVVPPSDPVPSAEVPDVPAPPDESPGEPQAFENYDFGSPTFREIWVDPVGGSDANSGGSREDAFRTVARAWGTIPRNTRLTTGVRVNLMPGRFTTEMVPNYWEDRLGTFSAPILFHSVDGARTASLSRVNMFNSSYVYFDNVRIEEDGGEIVHCEQCDHFLIRDSVIRSTDRGQETVKVNQSKYVYIEDSDISVASDNAVDFVAVQYGHLLKNRIHDTTGGWCAYTKGGSAYINVIANEFDHCIEGGFTAGQGAGIEFLTAPWNQYEAYYIRVSNNVVHDIYGAAFGVNGGFEVSISHNTAYRVGARSHLVEFVYGGHECDGHLAACAASLEAGAWGPPAGAPSGVFTRIPNLNVSFVNNVIYNPSGYQSRWQHLEVSANYESADQGLSGAPNPARADEKLYIRGNVIWDGPFGHGLGIGPGTGCSPTQNATCNPTVVTTWNTINANEPQFTNPAGGNFRPLVGGNIASYMTAPIPVFAGWAPSGVTVPSTDTSVPIDRDGRLRGSSTTVGAYLP